MNQITRPLEVIESEINIFKSQTATGIIEIGKRLIEAKEQLPHGKWGEWLEEKVEFSERSARRFMQVAEECSKWPALTDLPQTKVFLLLDIPEDQREGFIKSNAVEEMTTRKLQEVIQEKKKLEKQLEDEKNKPPMEVEVAPPDYNLLKQRITIKEKEIEDLKRQKKILELKVDVTEQDAERYTTLKNNIETLTKEKSDLGRMINSTTELAGLVMESKNFFELKLAPVRYSRAIQEASEDDVVKRNLTEIIETFQGWINEMNRYISNNADAIEVEVTVNEQ